MNDFNYQAVADEIRRASPLIEGFAPREDLMKAQIMNWFADALENVGKQE